MFRQRSWQLILTGLLPLLVSCDLYEIEGRLYLTLNKDSFRVEEKVIIYVINRGPAIQISCVQRHASIEEGFIPYIIFGGISRETGEVVYHSDNSATISESCIVPRGFVYSVEYPAAKFSDLLESFSEFFIRIQVWDNNEARVPYPWQKSFQIIHS